MSQVPATADVLLLEAETGQATRFKQNGAISVALNTQRMEELLRKRCHIAHVWPPMAIGKPFSP